MHLELSLQAQPLLRGPGRQSDVQAPRSQEAYLSDPSELYLHLFLHKVKYTQPEKCNIHLYEAEAQILSVSGRKSREIYCQSFASADSVSFQVRAALHSLCFYNQERPQLLIQIKHRPQTVVHCTIDLEPLQKRLQHMDEWMGDKLFSQPNRPAYLISDREIHALACGASQTFGTLTLSMALGTERQVSLYVQQLGVKLNRVKAEAQKKTQLCQQVRQCVHRKQGLDALYANIPSRQLNELGGEIVQKILLLNISDGK